MNFNLYKSLVWFCMDVLKLEWLKLQIGIVWNFSHFGFRDYCSFQSAYETTNRGVSCQLKVAILIFCSKKKTADFRSFWMIKTWFIDFSSKIFCVFDVTESCILHQMKNFCELKKDMDWREWRDADSGVTALFINADLGFPYFIRCCQVQNLAAPSKLSFVVFEPYGCTGACMTNISHDAILIFFCSWLHA